jgi:ligand-binding sensor domain-containing protein
LDKSLRTSKSGNYSRTVPNTQEMKMKTSIALVALCLLIGSCGYKSEDVPASERDGGIGEAEDSSRDFSFFKPDQSPWYYSEWTERTSDVGKLSFFLQDKQGYFWGVNEKDHLIRYNGYDIKDFHNGKLIEDENSFNCTQLVTIFEDSRGYIWLESYCGLYRYDPELERFTNLSDSVINDTGVIPTIYHSIIEDQDGLIWIGTQAGVFYYDYATGRFSFVRGGLFHALLLFEDEEGAIWNGSSVYEMRLYRISKDSLK